MAVDIVILLFVAGLLSGIVNAIAGGGTFLTFAAMTIAGVPPISANATSSIVQFPGYVTSVLAYRAEIRAHWREALLLSLVSAGGSLIGAALLLSLDNASFRQLVPWLLLGATALFAAGPWLRPSGGKAGAFAHNPLGVALQVATSIYGGFFGAGLGIMTLAALGVTIGGAYHHLNALKNLLSVVIAAVAIVVFFTGGVIAWNAALVMIPAAAIGGYCGVYLARRIPQGLIRAVVIAAGLLLAAYYGLLS